MPLIYKKPGIELQEERHPASGEYLNVLLQRRTVLTGATGEDRVKLRAHDALEGFVATGYASTNGVVQHARVCLLVLGPSRDPNLQAILGIDETRHVDAIDWNPEQCAASALNVDQSIAVWAIDWVELISPSVENLEMGAFPFGGEGLGDILMPLL